MPNWMVKLSGHEFDLRALASLYNEPGCRVAKDIDDAYYLTCDAFEAMGEAAAVDGAAREWLAIVNADMRLHDTNYAPVSLGHITQISDDGTRTDTHVRSVQASAALIGSSRFRVNGTVLGPDGLPVPSPEPARAQARLNLIEHDERAREALDYSQRCNPNDADCLSYAYKVSEIILEDMGGGDAAKGVNDVKKSALVQKRCQSGGMTW